MEASQPGDGGAGRDRPAGARSPRVGHPEGRTPRASGGDRWSGRRVSRDCHRERRQSGQQTARNRSCPAGWGPAAAADLPVRESSRGGGTLWVLKCSQRWERCLCRYVVITCGRYSTCIPPRRKQAGRSQPTRRWQCADDRGPAATAGACPPSPTHTDRGDRRAAGGHGARPPQTPEASYQTVVSGGGWSHPWVEDRLAAAGRQTGYQHR